MRFWMICLVVAWTSLAVGCAQGTQDGGPCSNDGDCGSGLCRDGVCVEDSSCENDFDCPVGQLCLNRSCQPIDGATNNAPANNAPANNAPANNAPANNAPANNEPANNEPNNAPNNAPNNTPNNTPNNNPGGCVADEDCEASEHCDNQQCVPGCHRDEGCLLGQVCEVATHTCVAPGCASDMECADGEVCNVETGECEPAPVVCGEVTCEEGQWCDQFPVECISELPGAECVTDADCAEGEACTPGNDAEDGLVLVCRPAVGETLGGEACESDEACRSGLCVAGTCYAACGGDEDCSVGEATCQQVPVLSAGGPTFTVPACLETVPCTRDGDCPEGDVCALVTFGEGLEALCQASTGELPAGSLCAEDTECASGVCFGTGIRRCLGVCAQDEDCQPANTACIQTDFLIDDNDTPDDPADDVTAPFNVCDWSEGTQRPCVNDASCGVDEICTLGTNDAEETITVCRPAWGGAGPGGDCAVDNDCQSGLCINNQICLGACAGDTDCLGGADCAPVPISEEPGAPTLDLCVPPPALCSSDLDCGEGLFCQPILDPDNPNAVVGACLAPAEGGGTGLAGESCAVDGDCVSGFCLGNFNGEGRVCYGICEEGTDRGCNNGTRCYPNYVRLTLDQGTESTLDDRYDSTTACVEDFGSFGLCQNDSACPAGEICYPFTNRTVNAFEPRCIDALVPNGLTRGTTCVRDDECASNLCLQGLFSNFCLTLCASSGDCTGLRVCDAATFTVNNRGTDSTLDDITGPLNICQ